MHALSKCGFGVAFCIGAFFGYGAVYSGSTVLVQPMAYIKSFGFENPERGQGAPEYMMGALIERAHVIRSSGGSKADVQDMQAALFMKLDREFPKGKTDTRTLWQKLNRIPTYEQAKAMTDYEYDRRKGYVDDGVHIKGAAKPSSGNSVDWQYSHKVIVPKQ